MRNERSAGAIIYRQGKGFLLLRHRDGHWEFPKGKLEEGEDWKEAMRREIAEETGVTEFSRVPFRYDAQYSFYRKGPIEKEVRYFLLLTEQDAVLSEEHTDLAWLSAEAAAKKLRFKNHRDALAGAVEALRERGVLE